MKNIAIVGGMGSGKTTLARAIVKEDPKIHYIPMSLYGARIPMSLIATTHPDLLSLPKPKYIQTVLENQHIELINLAGQRQEMDEFGRTVHEQYGPTIIAETAVGTLIPGVQNLADNVCTANNVLYFKNKGFYIVGLYCGFDIKLVRCFKRRSVINPKNTSDLEKQILSTDKYFESSKTIHFADFVYDTGKKELIDYPQIAREILDVTR